MPSAPPHALFTDHGGPAEPIFKIGLRPISPADWFEPPEADDDPAARKAALYAEHGALSWGETAGSEAGQAEVAAMIADHLGMPLPEGEDAPLKRAALMVADDLCLMEKRAEGWTLTAASLCAPSFFSALDAVGKPLQGLHDPVPTFNDTLLTRVARIFDHLQVGDVVERRNWSVVNSDDLFIPDPTFIRRRLPGMTLDEIADALVVRRERQTLRKAPETGAVLFTIRIWREPLNALLADPARRAAFAEAWEQLMSDEGAPFRTYKRLELFDAAVRARLTELGTPVENPA